MAKKSARLTRRITSVDQLAPMIPETLRTRAVSTRVKARIRGRGDFAPRAARLVNHSTTIGSGRYSGGGRGSLLRTGRFILPYKGLFLGRCGVDSCRELSRVRGQSCWGLRRCAEVGKGAGGLGPPVEVWRRRKMRENTL